MFRAKQTKIWRVKSDGRLLRAKMRHSDSFRTEPKFSWQIEAFLKESGLDSIQVVNTDETISLFNFSYKSGEPSFDNYFTNHSTVDLLVPKSFECDWRFY